MGGIKYKENAREKEKTIEEIEAYHVGGINTIWRSAGLIPIPPLPQIFSLTPAIDRHVLYMNIPTAVHLIEFSVMDEGMILADVTFEVYKNEDMADKLLATTSYAMTKAQQEIWCPHHKWAFRPIE